ncbi:hypothetical protein LSAT2_017004 [Lamellibrachia satsuma]|nr:hypothetical protein LSAT2_017004 [Lamellibrachia satsuma]
MFPSVLLPVDRDPAVDGAPLSADLSHARRSARAKKTSRIDWATSPRRNYRQPTNNGRRDGRDPRPTALCPASYDARFYYSIRAGRYKGAISLR